jgi:hypothetical protein
VEVRPYAADLQAGWNAFNAAARNGHFMFDRNFMDYHADRFGDASLVFLEEQELVGLIPANRSGEVIHSHQGLTFGGLIVADARTEQIMAMLDAAAESWRAAGASRLLYKAMPWIYHRRPSQEDHYWIFRAGGTLVRRDLSVSINYRDARPISKRRRRGADKAARAGLSVSRSRDFGAYWALLESNLRDRHGVAPTHSLAEIERLSAAFPEQIALYVAQTADGEIRAGVVLFLTATVAHAQYISASEEGRQVGALDQVFSHLIETFSTTHAYFDFGVSNEDQGRTLNSGLIRQKEEFGASGVPHDFYAIDL